MPIKHGSPREKLYNKVRSFVGDTPLYEIANIHVPNGCRIFCKEEYLNPTGSHYDRFWVEYLYHLEDTNRATTGHILIETSTGNSGISFAWACRALGFTDYRLVIPEDMPFTRIRQIEDFGAKVIKSEQGRYVEGLIETFAKYIDEVRSNPQNQFCIPNHSRYGEASIHSIEKIAEEVVESLTKKYNVGRLDYFVTALGNGLSTKGMGEYLRKKFKKISLIGIEASQSPTIYLKRHQDKARPLTAGKTHGLLGTSPGIDPTIFPIMNGYADCLDDIDLIEEVQWTQAGIDLANNEGKLVGHTSAASFFEAMKIAKKVNNKNILIVFYDPAWKYL